MVEKNSAVESRQSSLSGTLERRIQAPEKIPYPGEHLGLSWRRIQNADMPAIIELYREAGSGLIAGEDSSIEAFSEFLAAALAAGAHADTLAGWNSAGEVKAFALVKVAEDALTELQAQIVGVVSDSWRGKGIGRTILEWQDGRARQLLLADGRDLPFAICTQVDARNTERRRLLTAGGFSAKCRFTTFQRSLTAGDAYLGKAARESIAAKGYTLLPFSAEYDEELRRIFNRILISHSQRQRQPLSETNWKIYRKRFSADNSLLLLQEGIIIGYALCMPNQEALVVKDFGVERGMRDKSLETELVLALIANAISAEFSQLQVEIGSEMKMEESFLSPFGFTPDAANIVYSIDL
ncbi:MAG: hypothetical protein KH423_03500 [Actinomycetaceae bacterium]|nr:hypothetical protein [Actinomycetaceae bacterium]